ncbi:Calcium/calmodulin-dependent protein kinase [Cytospora mali]|uniref:Calcium/calmodulin-dependent protein kinase n=1 Tax=Cytospora mali TaxID=578113 RepID=A0A194WA65_CYTMA|nr:Calcium/calmodulin-dependent protein kinase [Valsa mali]
MSFWHNGSEAGESDDTQQTNPFPPGYVEARVQLDNIVNKYVQEHVRIDQLELDQPFQTPLITRLLPERNAIRPPPFRLRLRHKDGNKAINLQGAGAWFILASPKKGVVGLPGGKVEILGVDQQRQNWMCPLLVGAISCELIYDPDSDDVIVGNTGSLPLSVQPLPGTDTGPLMIDVGELGSITPALWEFVSGQDTVEVEVLPRQYLLHVEQNRAPAITASKRSLSQEDASQKKKARGIDGPLASTAATQTEAGPEPEPENLGQPQSVVVRDDNGSVTAAFQLQPGQRLCMVDKRTGNTEYSVRRLSQWGHSTPSSDMFRAILKGSSQKGEVVVVKIVKSTLSDRQAAVENGGREWWKECYINQRLNHPHIARMVGFDYRIRCFYFEHKDAKDLSSTRWCFGEDDQKPHFFKGTINDACCILADIASALAYLRRQELDIVHGEVKPGNIIYHRNRRQGNHFSRATRPGAFLVNFDLARPKHIPKHKRSSPWYTTLALDRFIPDSMHHTEVDIYGLGVVMLYLLGRTGLPERVASEMGWDPAEYEAGDPVAIEKTRIWFKRVETMRQGLQATPDCTKTEAELMTIVRNMLLPVGKAITAVQLEEVTRKWASTKVV